MPLARSRTRQSQLDIVMEGTCTSSTAVQPRSPFPPAPSLQHPASSIQHSASISSAPGGVPSPLPQQPQHLVPSVISTCSVSLPLPTTTTPGFLPALSVLLSRHVVATDVARLVCACARCCATTCAAAQKEAAVAKGCSSRGATLGGVAQGCRACLVYPQPQPSPATLPSLCFRSPTAPPPPTHQPYLTHPLCLILRSLLFFGACLPTHSRRLHPNRPRTTLPALCIIHARRVLPLCCRRGSMDL